MEGQGHLNARDTADLNPIITSNRYTALRPTGAGQSAGFAYPTSSLGKHGTTKPFPSRHGLPQCHCRSRCPCRHPATQKRQALEASHGGRHRAQRGSAGIEIPWPRDLAKLERIPPPKSCRDKDALHETSGATPHGAGLQPTSRRGPSPHCHHERLYRARHTRHENRGVNVSGERGKSVQRRLCATKP